MNIKPKSFYPKFDIPTLKKGSSFHSRTAGELTFNNFQANGVPLVVVKAQVHAGGRGKGIIYIRKQVNPY